MKKRRTSNSNGGDLLAILMFLGFVVVAICGWLVDLWRGGREPPRRDLNRKAPPSFPDPQPDVLSATVAELAEAHAERDRWKVVAQGSKGRQAETAAEVDRLRALKVALEQDRDRWKIQAQSAQSADAQATSGPTDRKKFMKLRAVVVTSLHPDHGDDPPAEKAIRAALFKRIWPQIKLIQDEA